MGWGWGKCVDVGVRRRGSRAAGWVVSKSPIVFRDTTVRRTQSLSDD